uniref:Secreted protein n=1 Tax=Arundo donax TaxID=35708 RepID=A0A0A9AIS0_ARUDO
MNLTVRVALLFFRDLCAANLEQKDALWETVADGTLSMTSCATTAAPNRVLILCWPNRCCAREAWVRSLQRGLCVSAASSYPTVTQFMGLRWFVLSYYSNHKYFYLSSTYINHSTRTEALWLFG